MRKITLPFLALPLLASCGNKIQGKITQYTPYKQLQVATTSSVYTYYYDMYYNTLNTIDTLSRVSITREEGDTRTSSFKEISVRSFKLSECNYTIDRDTIVVNATWEYKNIQRSSKYTITTEGSFKTKATYKYVSYTISGFLGKDESSRATNID